MADSSIFLCEDTTSVCLFIHWYTFRLLPSLHYYEQWCSNPSCSGFCVKTCFQSSVEMLSCVVILFLFFIVRNCQAIFHYRSWTIFYKPAACDGSNFLSLILFFPFSFLRQHSWIHLASISINYITEAGFELLIFLPTVAECWDYRNESSY